MSGTLSGAVNGHAIPASELYAYIELATGQQHTAAARVPADAGAWSLQLLDSIGFACAWLFARVESDDVRNGFELTGEGGVHAAAAAAAAAVLRARI